MGWTLGENYQWTLLEYHETQESTRNRPRKQVDVDYQRTSPIHGFGSSWDPVHSLQEFTSSKQCVTSHFWSQEWSFWQKTIHFAIQQLANIDPVFLPVLWLYLLNQTSAMDKCLAPLHAWLRCTSKVEEAGAAVLAKVAKVSARNPWKLLGLQGSWCKKQLKDVERLYFESKMVVSTAWVIACHDIFCGLGQLSGSPNIFEAKLKFSENWRGSGERRTGCACQIFRMDMRCH